MGKFLHGKPLGGGLYQVGGDIETDEKIISIKIESAKVTYHFETFDFVVTWEEPSKGIRTNIHWERVSKE